MNIEKIFALFLLIVSFSLLVSAQDKNKELEKLAEQQRLEDMRRQQEELLESMRNPTPFIADSLDYFLPKTKNAWFISITTHGGFAGGTRLVAAVNSDGKYLCTLEQDFSNQLVAADVFTPFYQTIDRFEFKKYNSDKAKKIEYCNDCPYTTLTFQKGKNTYTYSRNSFADAESEIKAVYDQVIESSGCR